MAKVTRSGGRRQGMASGAVLCGAVVATGAACWGAAPASAATVSYDFNTAGQYAANFQANNGAATNAGNNFTQAAAGGLGGSGSLTATASDGNGTSVDTTDAFNLATAGQVALAGYFTPTATTGNAAGPGAVFQLGLTASTSGSFGGTNAIDSLTGRVVAPTSNGGAGNAISFTTSGGVAAVGTLTPVQVVLTPGTTYLLSVVLTPAATNATPGTTVAFTAAESLYVADPTTGAVTTAPIASFAASFTDSALNATNGGLLFGDTTARFGFRGAAVPAAPTNLAELSTGSVDSLSVTTGVPEPTTLATAAVVAVPLAAGRRRRTRRA